MLDFKSDEKVTYHGEEYVIVKVGRDLVHVELKHTVTGKNTPAKISEISQVSEKEIRNEHKPLDAFTEKELQKANERLKIIKTLVDGNPRTKEKVEAVAKANGLHAATVYRWISDYEDTHNVGSLVDKDGRGGKGKVKMNSETSKVIDDKIMEVYLQERKSTPETVRQIYERCKELGLPQPHENSIRNRIGAIDEYTRTKYRKGLSAAENEYGPAVNKFPGANYPLEIVQIDHTLLDVMVVDEIYREPLSRAWFTLLIDSFSRAVLGFYLSLDPPGTYGTGRAIVHAMLGKESYLASLGLNSEWPCWGKIITLLCDNAREFKGKTLNGACSNYGMNITFRPVKKPQYGGHIERMMGTFNSEIHNLDGSTNNNLKIRDHFKPEQTASMTLKELERWLTIFITEVYMKREHASLGMSPTQKWIEGIFGTNHQPGIGVPGRFTQDETRLRNDFLPTVSRTVQRQGVSIDKINYYSDVLTKWINAPIKTPAGKILGKRKFVFKEDPRDISEIYFLDPDQDRYFKIPYMNISGPKMSRWEYNKVIRRLKENKQPINEGSIFEGYKKMRALEDEARKKTKHTRKRNDREARVAEDKKSQLPKVKAVNHFFDEEEDIKPFDQIMHESLN